MDYNLIAAAILLVILTSMQYSLNRIIRLLVEIDRTLKSLKGRL
jgi:hypothetical protein